MEAERKKVKGEQQFSDKNTPYNIREKKRKEAVESREKNKHLTALYNLFMPGARNVGRPKFITDKYGNRVRSGMEIKVEEK